MSTAAQPWQAAPSWLPLFIEVYKAKLQTMTSINTHFLQIVSSESQEDCWGPVFVSPTDACLNEGGDHAWFLCSIPVLDTKSVPSSQDTDHQHPMSPSLVLFIGFHLLIALPESSSRLRSALAILLGG